MGLLKTKNLIFSIILITLVVSAAVIAFVLGLQLSPYENRLKTVLIALLLSVASGVCWYLVHNAMHELMHALFCAAFGGKVIEIAFWGIRFYRKGERFKLGFSLRSSFAGWTSFVTLRAKESYKTLYFSLFGGLLGTLITIITCAVTFRISSSFFGYYLSIIGFFVLLYLLIVNFICDFPSNDGHLLFLRNEGYSDFCNTAIRLETEGYLYHGKSLTEIESFDMLETFAEEKKPNYYDYLTLLETGDIESAITTLEEIDKNLKSSDNELIDPFIERIFIYSVTNNELEADRAFDLCGNALEESFPDAIRAHAVYRKLKGEKDWYLLLKESYYKSLDFVELDGLKRSFRAIGDRFLD